MKKAKNRERQRALSGTALSDEAEDFAGLYFERDVAQNSGLVAIIHREPEREKWRSLVHFCAPKAGSGPRPRRRTSAFQKAWGSRTEGAEPTTAGEMEEMESLLARQMKGCWSATICWTRCQAALGFLCEEDRAWR